MGTNLQESTDWSPEQFLKNRFPLIVKRCAGDEVVKSTEEYCLQKLPWSNIYNKNNFLTTALTL